MKDLNSLLIEGTVETIVKSSYGALFLPRSESEIDGLPTITSIRVRVGDALQRAVFQH
jgi:hypothetical protein